MRELKRNLHLYQNKYSLQSDFQTISMLQHYGAPTRLLDFTQSQYVAAFFASNSIANDGAIYAINFFELLSSTAALFRMKYDDQSEEIELFKKSSDMSDDKIFSKLVLNKKQRKFVQMVQPFFLFDRMIQQSGCFLCQGDINETFETNLKSNFKILQKLKSCSPYYKIKVNQDWKNEILRDLDRMNITSQSLFPGIEGFTKSLQRKFDITIKDKGDSLINVYG